jgi:hypothetical protein
MTGRENPADPKRGEVSEVASLADDGEADPIVPEEATAGYPEGESGTPDEGTAGPDAPPRHGRPEPGNKSSH